MCLPLCQPSTLCVLPLAERQMLASPSSPCPASPAPLCPAPSTAPDVGFSQLTLPSCSCCCFCFSRNCWCCCCMTSCCRAWGLWGSGEDWVRLRGRCRGSLPTVRMLVATRSPVTSGDCPWSGTEVGEGEQALLLGHQAPHSHPRLSSFWNSTLPPGAGQRVEPGRGLEQLCPQT